MAEEARIRVQKALQRLAEATPRGGFSVHRHSAAYRLTKVLADTAEKLSRAEKEVKDKASSDE